MSWRALVYERETVYMRERKRARNRLRLNVYMKERERGRKGERERGKSIILQLKTLQDFLWRELSRRKDQILLSLRGRIFLSVCFGCFFIFSSLIVFSSSLSLSFSLFFFLTLQFSNSFPLFVCLNLFSWNQMENKLDFCFNIWGRGRTPETFSGRNIPVPTNLLNRKMYL